MKIPLLKVWFSFLAQLLLLPSRAQFPHSVSVASVNCLKLTETDYTETKTDTVCVCVYKLSQATFSTFNK